MPDALVQGREVIENLMQAGLLEAGDIRETVKMHDVIRDMSLWLACERGEKKNKIWVDVSDDFSVTPIAMAKWGSNVEKVLLWGWGWGTSLESLAGLSFCSNLVTLIIQHTKLEKLSGEIFLSMKVLKVLDLSRNWKLKRLPIEIGGLTSLEYLNITGTNVITLPVEVEQLKKLRLLMVPRETVIPRTVLSSLRLLLTFEQGKGSNRDDYEAYRYDYPADRILTERGMLEELEGLEHIMYLRLTLFTAAGIRKLLNSPKLQSRTGELSLTTKDSLPAEHDLATRTLTKHLEKLLVVNSCVSVIKLGSTSLCSNIREVSFYGCGKIRNLNSLVYVPDLCILEVTNCLSMEELIGEDAEESTSSASLFTRLTRLVLVFLPNLQSICPGNALSFPCLELMTVYDCFGLRKLPLDSNTANTTPPRFKIEGNGGWWDGLGWDSQSTKDAFTPKFVLRSRRP